MIEKINLLQNAFTKIISRIIESPRNKLIILTLFSLIPSFIIYAFNSNDLSVIFRYWDGPNYIEVAKTLYNIPDDHPLKPYGTTPAYFACHLPLYPLLISIFSFMTYPIAMIFVSLLTSVLSTISFYYLLIEYNCVKSPFFSAIILTFLPIRWLLYKSIGSTEALFLLLVFLSLIAYKKNKLVWAMIFASLSGVTRIVGILFFVIYFIEFIRTKNYKALPLLSIIGIPLFLTFSFYSYQFNDFFAYFSWNNKLIHSNPLDIYFAYTGNGNSQESELYFLFYSIYGLGVLLLWEFPILLIYSSIFYFFNLFIFHEDLSRYFLTITPFVLIIAYDRIFNTKEFKIFSIFIFYLSIIYSTNLLPRNVVEMSVYNNLINQP